MYAAGWELRGHAEDGVDELALRYGIALSYPADLTFADCVHRLVAFDRSAYTLYRAESLALMPDLRALKRETAFPSGVRAPVDNCELRRFASI